MLLLVMGVSGAGKSKIGSEVAKALGWPFLDADDFHPPSNREKLRAGVPLTDDDRSPWLDAVRERTADALSGRTDVVLACSALKERYRELLGVRDGDAFIAFLKASTELLETRLSSRQGHFFNPSLLTDQLGTLEEPNDALELDASEEAGEIVKKIVAAITARG